MDDCLWIPTALATILAFRSLPFLTEIPIRVSVPTSAMSRLQLESQEAEDHVSSVPQDEWKWTLNWDYITPQLVVGSCPRSPSDIVRPTRGGHRHHSYSEP